MKVERGMVVVRGVVDGEGIDDDGKTIDKEGANIDEKEADEGKVVDG